MKVAIYNYDVATGELLGCTETTLARFAAENQNAPAQWVIRQEIREIGAYITVCHGIRTEVVRL